MPMPVAAPDGFAVLALPLPGGGAGPGEERRIPAEREGISLSRRNRPANPKAPIMTGTSQTPSRISRRERLFVLGGLVLAALFTAASPVLRTGAGLAWIAAIAWTVLASLAAALWQGFRHRDWSAFRGYEFPEDREEEIDWSTRTGTSVGTTPIDIQCPHRMALRKTPGYCRCTQAGKTPYNWGHGGGGAHYRHS